MTMVSQGVGRHGSRVCERGRDCSRDVVLFEGRDKYGKVFRTTRLVLKAVVSKAYSLRENIEFKCTKHTLVYDTRSYARLYLVHGILLYTGLTVLAYMYED